MSTMREQFEAWFKPAADKYKAHDRDYSWMVWQAATEAAKATGTAGELPPLPDPHPITEWDSKGRAYDFDQMRAYGQQCAEAARQPAPVVMPPAVAVSRDADSPGMTGVLVTFARPLSDGQLRELHEYLNRSQP